jgi:hypothetical protein
MLFQTNHLNLATIKKGAEAVGHIIQSRQKIIVNIEDIETIIFLDAGNGFYPHCELTMRQGKKFKIDCAEADAIYFLSNNKK